MLSALLVLYEAAAYAYFIVSVAVIIVAVVFDTIVPVNGGQKDF